MCGNTFQLIISDGTDTIIPANNNIAFCYGDMQWTTGAASSGIGGFGGTAATVGANGFVGKPIRAESIVAMLENYQLGSRQRILPVF